MALWRRGDSDDLPIRIKRAELERLVDALRDGAEEALPVKHAHQQGFRLGWEAAMSALDEIAEQLPR